MTTQNIALVGVLALVGAVAYRVGSLDAYLISLVSALVVKNMQG